MIKSGHVVIYKGVEKEIVKKGDEYIYIEIK